MTRPLIRDMKVVGTHFRTTTEKAAIAALSGTDADGYLEAEPTNEHDRYAVKVCTMEGVHCGYIPATCSGLCLVAFSLEDGQRQPAKLVVQATKGIDVYVSVSGE